MRVNHWLYICLQAPTTLPSAYSNGRKEDKCCLIVSSWSLFPLPLYRRLLSTSLSTASVIRIKFHPFLEADMKRKGVDEPSASDYTLRSQEEKLEREEVEYDPSQPCYLDRLPDEVLASIIRLLPWKKRITIVEPVSRRWRRVALEGGWKDFTMFNSREWSVPVGRCSGERSMPPKVSLTARGTLVAVCQTVNKP